jgi:hypothetical protein
MREAGVMVITHKDVSETSPSLFAAIPRPASTLVQRSMFVDTRTADDDTKSWPLKAQAASATVSSPQAKSLDSDKQPSISAAATSPSINAADPSAAPIVNHPIADAQQLGNSSVTAALSAAQITSPLVASVQQPSKNVASNLATGKIGTRKV